jgi:hypothetical protein
MTDYFDPIVDEVRNTRAELQKEYGGWEGYLKHQEEERPILEAQGWHFETENERSARMKRT